jgi:hypothetical protein
MEPASTDTAPPPENPATPETSADTVPTVAFPKPPPPPPPPPPPEKPRLRRFIASVPEHSGTQRPATNNAAAAPPQRQLLRPLVRPHAAAAPAPVAAPAAALAAAPIPQPPPKPAKLPSLEMLLGDSPPPLGAGAAHFAAGQLLNIPHSSSRKEKWRRFYIKLGGDSLALSLVIHTVVILLAIFVIGTVLPPKITLALGDFEPRPPGGGNNMAEHRVKAAPHKNMKPRSVEKITVKAPSSVSITSSKTLLSLLPGQGGGGDGSGFGPGPPGLPSFIPRLGLKIKAIKIAVYLDDSGSMRPYLDSVKREIYAQFPHADIFEFDGILTRVSNNRVIGGANGENKPTPGSATRVTKKTEGETDEDRRKGLQKLMNLKIAPAALTEMSKAKREEEVARLSDEQRAYYNSNLRNTARGDTFLRLTDQGREIFRAYSQNFHNGSVGAWTDIMMYENYDALVIFSDFQDGIQDNKVPVGEKELTWEMRWEQRFALAKRSNGMGNSKAPKLYLISTEVPPQEIWQRCVKASGGEISMKPQLRR